MKKRGFTLTELLVSVGIILVLVSLIGAAVSSTRGNQKKLGSQSLVSKLDLIIQQQYASYTSRPITSATSSAQRAEALRKLVSGDMPDNWKDVSDVLVTGTVPLLTSGTTYFPLNAAQRAYAGYYRAISPSPANADAECLFMIVMVGGLADCLECRDLGTSQVGDTDSDNAPEFLDTWGNPIRYVLWPAGAELPPGSGTRFFSSTAPFTTGSVAPAKGGIMQPLIFSGGPDGKGTLAVTGTFSHILTGSNCGNPADSNVITFGSFAPPSDDPADRRADNITNFDDEAKQ